MLAFGLPQSSSFLLVLVVAFVQAIVTVTLQSEQIRSQLSIQWQG